MLKKLKIRLSLKFDLCHKFDIGYLCSVKNKFVSKFDLEFRFPNDFVLSLCFDEF